MDTFISPFFAVYQFGRWGVMNTAIPDDDWKKRMQHKTYCQGPLRKRWKQARMLPSVEVYRQHKERTDKENAARVTTKLFEEHRNRYHHFQNAAKANDGKPVGYVDGDKFDEKAGHEQVGETTYHEPSHYERNRLFLIAHMQAAFLSSYDGMTTFL